MSSQSIETFFPFQTVRAEGRLLVGFDKGIGVIAFNNPSKHNALDRDMTSEMAAAIQSFTSNDAVKVIILTGTGQKAFVSGADIGGFSENTKSGETFLDYQNILAKCPKPTIAVIQGYCLGGGLMTALNCDIRLAAEGARFGIPAAKLGLSYGSEGLRRCSQIIGPARTKLLLFTANQIDCATAFQFGLIEEIIPSQDIWSSAFSTAEAIVKNAPLSVKATKFTVDQLMADPELRDMKAVEARSRECFLSEDFKEGQRAFLEKRPANFKGQ